MTRPNKQRVRSIDKGLSPERAMIDPACKVGAVAVQSAAMNLITEESLGRAAALHQKVVVMDTHCDTTQRLADPAWDMGLRDDAGHVDLPRLREGSVDGIFFAVYAPELAQPGDGERAVQTQIGHIRQMVERHAGDMALARTASDVRSARAAGKVAVLIAIEGGHLIEDNLERLRSYREQGATYLTLTHSFHTHWADSAGVQEDIPPCHGGLTEFGRDVVRELNRLGMMVDISHVSDDTFWQALETSAAPIIATHSSCRAVSPHRRNMSDEMIQAVADSGGVVQINFAALFLDPHAPALRPDALQRWLAGDGVHRERLTDHVTPLSVLVDHFDHALKLVGPAHVGIGTDFDGVPALPEDMSHCGMLPHLTAALFDRGYTEEDLTPMLGENVLRVMDACAAVATSP